jgi:hypothetical protein
VTRTLAASAVIAAAAVFSWWEGGLHQFQTAAHLSVLATIALVVVVAVAAGVGRQVLPSREWARGPFALRRHLAEDPTASLGALIWTVLVLAVIGWDLNSFAHQSHTVPTLSTIFGHVTDSHGGRAALFFGWLVLGASLALGWRRR